MLSLAQYKTAWLERDRFWARRLHQAAACAPLVTLLIFVSVLGDGLIWAIIGCGLWLLGGETGEHCVRLMLALGVLNVALYLLLKRSMGRPRPYQECPDILACTRALDRYSFPSGHTLHAVAFSTLLQFFYPLPALALWGFTVLVALSRIILGLHYPSDVLAAVGIGLLTSGGLLAALLYYPF
jgi:undecaprenyl-diphosphatase